MKRIGFAPATCRLSPWKSTPAPTFSPTRSFENPDASPSSSVVPVECAADVKGVMYPLNDCNAQCNRDPAVQKTSYLAEGVQKWADRCLPPSLIEERKCHVPCSSDNKILMAPNSINCPSSAWSDCTKSCEQTKIVQHASLNGACSSSKTTVSRSCGTGLCPIASGAVFITPFNDLNVIMFFQEIS